MEVWKPVTGYEGLYEVSNEGRVKSLLGWNGKKYVEREKLLNPYKQKASKNYYRLVVKLTKDKIKKDFKVHRLVAAAFMPNHESKPNINHKDGDPLNNKVDNLEWCTQEENVVHAIETGLRRKTRIPKGELERLYIEENELPETIAKKYGTTKNVVRNRLMEYGIPRKSPSDCKNKYRLTREFLLKELETKTQRQLAKEIGCDQSLISHYLKRIKNGGDIYA